METITIENFIKKYLDGEIKYIEDYLFKTETGLLYVEEIYIGGNGEIEVRNATLDTTESLIKGDKLYKIKD